VFSANKKIVFLANQKTKDHQQKIQDLKRKLRTNSQFRKKYQQRIATLFPPDQQPEEWQPLLPMFPEFEERNDIGERFFSELYKILQKYDQEEYKEISDARKKILDSLCKRFQKPDQKETQPQPISATFFNNKTEHVLDKIVAQNLDSLPKKTKEEIYEHLIKQETSLLQLITPADEKTSRLTFFKYFLKTFHQVTFISADTFLQFQSTTLDLLNHEFDIEPLLPEITAPKPEPELLKLHEEIQRRRQATALLADIYMHCKALEVKLYCKTSYAVSRP